MDRKDFRSLLSKLAGTTRTIRRQGAGRSALMTSVGRAMGIGAGVRAGSNFEHLEGRTLLEGSFANSILLHPDLTTGRVASTVGSGVGANVINPAVATTDNDFYSFVAPSTDFVTVLADTSNENPASTLNTRIQIFDSNHNPVASSVDNGSLTTGLATDGWAGFVAQAGQTYFVVVSGDYAGAPPNLTTGNTYTLRIAALSTPVDIGGDLPTDTGIAREHGSPAPDPNAQPPIPITPILGQLGGAGLPVTSRLRQDNIVYKLVLPNTAKWDGLITFNAQSNRPAGANQQTSTRLDTRLDIYNANGQLVAFDSDAGRINDAFTTLRAHPGDTYFVRVRSDEIKNANIQLATGPFWVVIDAIADKIALDPVTRRGGDPGGAFVGFGDPTIPPVPAMSNPVFQTALYEFTSQGTGLAIITMRPTGLDPVNDGALRLIDSNGTLIAFNDNFGGADPQIEADLVGGQRYFVIVDGFDLANGTQFTLNIESNHTFNAAQPIDDHVNTPTTGTPDAVRRQFELATGLKWSTPFPTLDADQNVQRDLGLRVTATGTGRIQAAGDTDLFQFTPQVSMLQQYAGNNDDNGTALYAGGAFDVADPNNPWPTASRNLAIWDAADWWFTGAQFTDPASGVQFGFQDNPATASTNRAEIYVLADWDPTNGAPPPAPGLTNHVLVVGGDFNLVVPTPFGPVTLTNLALWVQDPNTGNFVWDTADDFSTNGAVRAATVYDAPDPQAGPPVPPELYVGGDFTTIAGTGAQHLAFFNGAWNPVNIVGATARVNALVSFNPADPGPGDPSGTPPIPDPADPGNILVIGGQNFAGAAPDLSGNPNIPFANIIAWDGGALKALRAAESPTNPLTSPPIQPVMPVLDGPVFSLTVFTDPNGAGTNAPGDLLYVGGQFTQIGNAAGHRVAANNIVRWGRPTQPPNPPPTGFRSVALEWLPIGAGVNGPVFAMAVWDPADINNATVDPLVVVGGSFTTPGPNLVGTRGANFIDLGGADGIVRALTVVHDDQEPGIQANLDSGSQTGSTTQAGSHEGVVYAGGDFSNVNVTGAFGPNPVAANRVAQLAANTGPNNPDDFFEWTPLAGGVDNADPTAVPAASVFALTAFDDGNPFDWDRHDRPAQRLQIVVNPVDGSFVNTRVRVFDSNFNIVYGFDRPGSETIAPPFPDPSGMLDPNTQAPGFDATLSGITVWAGETYYIEISDSTGGGTGRYQFTVTAAAIPTDLNGDGVLDDVNAQYRQETNEGNFSAAPKIATQLGTGDGTNLVGTDALPFKGNQIRQQHISPFLNDSFVEAEDLGNISTIDDTDLYYFRAEFTGAAEIRVQTIGLSDEFAEALAGDVNGTFRPVDKTYNSHLDAAIRVYRNDFEQIAYDDDNLAISGERQDDSVGFAAGAYGPQSVAPQIPNTPVRVTFTRSDPRVVINVIAGNNYFIQVESGQKYKIGAPKLIADRTDNIARETDQRFENGSYRLLVNQMPAQNAEIINGQPVLDDHTNSNTAGGVLSNGLATVIPIGQDLGDPTSNGVGTMIGTIRNTPNNPADRDVFTFIAPGSGNMSIRVSRVGSGNTLNPTVNVYLFSHQTGQFTLAGTSAPISAGVVGLTLGALTGDTFMVDVAGSGGSQGAYRVDVSGIPAVDDKADFGKFASATDIRLFDFQGQGTANGTLENRGDTDVFRFSIADFSLVNISVVSHTATLNPAVTIYEVSEDPAGNPVYLRIGLNDGGGAGGTATVNVPVTPDRTVVVPPPGQNRTYPYYYVLVRGADPNSDFGAYTVNVNFTPTDDHPDGDTNGDGVFDTGEFPFASRIPLDSSTGQGNAVGDIEVNTDSDLFVFTAPAGGNATVLISRPITSTLRYKVSILDSQANVLASGIAADDPFFFTASASTAVVRNTDYFIVVEPIGPHANSTDTGQYTVSVTAPPVDDYPNAGEFPLASTTAVIPIDFTTGQGQLGGNAANDPSNPRLSPANDTDLFSFTTVRAGNMVVKVLPFSSALGNLAVRVTLFDAQGNQLQSVDSTAALQEVSLTISNAPTNTKYFVLVSAMGSVPASTPTGEYRVQLIGPPATNGGGGGGAPDAIDFNNPTTISLDDRTGDGQSSDAIDVLGDRDLFTFTTSAAGKVFVQLTAPNGSLLRASIRILNAANEQQSSEVAFDSTGIPGAIANVSFNGAAHTQYWVVVDGLGDSTGSYTVKVNTLPVVNRLVFPEGFASDTIREFVSIINPGDTTATYTVFLRYETGALETMIASTTITPHSRNGLTIIDGKNYQTPGIRLNTPYSIVLESDVPLGATLAHYDFGHAIGDSMTETASATWSFARAERTPGSVMDFVVFYNVNNFDVNATLTAYDSTGGAHSLTRSFGALRRGGFSINDIADFPTGVFGVTLTVTKASDGTTPAGVVASLSHYQLTGDAAFGLLGDPNGGSTSGIITNLAQGSHLNSELDFFNAGNGPATVTVIGSYIRTTLPQFTKTYSIAAKGQVKITGASLGLSPDQPIGIRYTSDQPIVAASDQVQLGDADSTSPGTVAGTESFFGDAFIDTRSAGVNYFETLWLANPTNVASVINVKLDFLDGSTGLIQVTVAAHGFSEIKLHTRPEILSTHTGPTWYSMDITSAIPFVASMTHYDLTLGGGWATSGVPFGITSPLSSFS